MLHNRLREAECTFFFNGEVKRIEPSSILIAADGKEKTLSPVDQVIIAIGLKPNENLKAFLRNSGTPHFIVGDALSPRRIIEATEEGAKAVWSI
jgi:thioredoxin reductase